MILEICGFLDFRTLYSSACSLAFSLVLVQREGGSGGGTIVGQGVPEEVAKVKGSHTGRFLGPLLKPKATTKAKRAKTVASKATKTAKKITKKAAKKSPRKKVKA